MPELGDAALVRCRRELRRLGRALRAAQLRIGLMATTLVTVTASLASLLWAPRPVLVWNASASSPIGLYHVTPPGGIRAGDMVLAWPPAAARALAGQRHYLPANVPLVKRVAAAPGDRVCAAGEAVFVKGRFLARRRRADSAERPLPWWTGCKHLRDGELFLLMPGARDSFDGRYFGATERRDVIGKAKLIWAR